MNLSNRTDRPSLCRKVLRIIAQHTVTRQHDDNAFAQNSCKSASVFTSGRARKTRFRTKSEAGLSVRYGSHQTVLVQTLDVDLLLRCGRDLVVVLNTLFSHLAADERDLGLQRQILRAEVVAGQERHAAEHTGIITDHIVEIGVVTGCLLYTSPSPRD